MAKRPGTRRLNKAVRLDAASATDKRPNILFITTDYTRGADLPVADLPLTGGATFLKAPTLSRLCEEGAVFARHNCAAPICMPARATIATGSYPHSHGLWDNGHMPVKRAGRPFLITDLRKQGYQTLGIGKMHWCPHKEDYDYDVRISLEGKDLDYLDDDYERYLAQHGYSREKIKQSGQSYSDWPIDEKLQADAFIGIKTLETIRSDKLSRSKPWFMWVSFSGPHNPWNAPKRCAEPYRQMPDLPTGDFIEGELATKPLDYSRHRYGYGGELFHRYDRSSETAKEEIRRGVRAGHYGLLTFIDEWMEKILAELKNRGQMDNTIVVFSSDHGSALFDNEMLHKGTALTTQSLVPFVVWQPGKVKPGIRDELTSHVDLYATFLELAGQKNPLPSEGKSLVDMLYSLEAKGHKATVVESTLVTSIMTKRWLCGFHPITKEIELYDLKNDPMCHRNIADAPERGRVIAGLKRELVAWRKDKMVAGETIGDDPLNWRVELGGADKQARVNRYWERYAQEHQRLTEMSENRPGKTGQAAAAVIRKAGLQREQG